jgi:hypothetical protein
MNTTSAPSNHEPEGITHDLTSPSEHEPRKIVNQDITYIASPKMSQESDNKPSATAGRDPPRQLWFKPPPLQQIGELYFEQGVDPRSTLRANLLSRARHDNESHPISCADAGAPGELDSKPLTAEQQQMQLQGFLYDEFVAKTPLASTDTANTPGELDIRHLVLCAATGVPGELDNKQQTAKQPQIQLQGFSELCPEQGWDPRPILRVDLLSSAHHVKGPHPISCAHAGAPGELDNKQQTAKQPQIQLQGFSELCPEQGWDPRPIPRADLLSSARHVKGPHPISCADACAPGELDNKQLTQLQGFSYDTFFEDQASIPRASCDLEELDNGHQKEYGWLDLQQTNGPFDPELDSHSSCHVPPLQGSNCMCITPRYYMHTAGGHARGSTHHSSCHVPSLQGNNCMSSLNMITCRPMVA